jgi:hypothetical protein
MVEPVLIHAEEMRRIAKADETRDRSYCWLRELAHHDPRFTEIQTLVAGSQFRANATP